MLLLCEWQRERSWNRLPRWTFIINGTVLFNDHKFYLPCVLCNTGARQNFLNEDIAKRLEQFGAQVIADPIKVRGAFGSRMSTGSISNLIVTLKKDFSNEIFSIVLQVILTHVCPLTLSLVGKVSRLIAWYTVSHASSSDMTTYGSIVSLVFSVMGVVPLCFLALS